MAAVSINGVEGRPEAHGEVRSHALVSERNPGWNPRSRKLNRNPPPQASTDAEEVDRDIMIGSTSAGTLKEIPFKYLTQRLGVTRDADEL